MKIRHFNLFYFNEKYNTDSSIGLASYNKKAYLKLREDYNSNPTPIKFYTLIVFAFNNQIRFNKDGKFNLPVNKRDFTSNMRKNLELFVDRIKNLDIEFTSKDFRDVYVPDNSFVYIDPPYLATTASYNENGGWNEELEQELLNYLDELNQRGWTMFRDTKVPYVMLESFFISNDKDLKIGTERKAELAKAVVSAIKEYIK